MSIMKKKKKLVMAVKVVMMKMKRHLSTIMEERKDRKRVKVFLIRNKNYKKE